MATAIERKSADFISKCAAFGTEMLGLPAQHMWIDYDKEADVLYMSFRKPQRATKTIEIGNDILVRKAGQRIVGMTILNASRRQ